jgi:hypothetical protein
MSSPVEVRDSTCSLTAALKPVSMANGPVPEMLFLARVPRISVMYNDTELPEGWRDGNGPWRGVGLSYADAASPLSVGMWFEEAERVPVGCFSNRSSRLRGDVGYVLAPGVEVDLSYELFSYDGTACVPSYEVDTWRLGFKGVRAAGPSQWINLEGGVTYHAISDRHLGTEVTFGADWYAGRFVGIGGEVGRYTGGDFSSLKVTSWRARITLSAGSRLSLECYVGDNQPSRRLDGDEDDVIGVSCTLRL